MNEKIIEKIKQSNKSQANIAKELGFAPQNFNRMLKNDDIKLSILKKIANILEVSVLQLIDDNDYKTNDDSKIEIQTLVGENKNLKEMLENKEKEILLLKEALEDKRKIIEFLEKIPKLYTKSKLEKESVK